MPPPLNPRTDLNSADTEDAMMATHAEQLRSSGMITDNEAEKISKPWHKTGVLNIQYSEEYLLQHPDYTGANAHAFASRETVRRRKVREDMEQRRLIKDYEAGRVDVDGIDVVEEQDGEHGSSKVDSSDETGGDDDDTEEESGQEEDDSSEDYHDDDDDEEEDKHINCPGGNTNNSGSNHAGNEDTRSERHHQDSSSNVSEYTPDAANQQNPNFKSNLQSY